MSASTLANFKDAQTWSEYCRATSKIYSEGYDGLAVLFTNPSCGFCVDTEKEFVELASEFPRICFMRLEIARPGRGTCIGAPGCALGALIQGTPTVFCFSAGKVVGSVVGAETKDELAQMLRGIPTTA